VEWGAVKQRLEQEVFRTRTIAKAGGADVVVLPQAVPGVLGQTASPGVGEGIERGDSGSNIAGTSRIEGFQELPQAVSGSGSNLAVHEALSAQLDAERRHTARLQSELDSYEASATFNLSQLEGGSAAVGESGAMLPENVAVVLPVLPYNATLQQKLTFYGTIVAEQIRVFFMDQPWGQAQIIAIYVFLLHYYSLFYKRSCL